MTNEFQVACFCSKSERPTGNRSCQLPPLSSLPFLLFFFFCDRLRCLLLSCGADLSSCSFIYGEWKIWWKWSLRYDFRYVLDIFRILYQHIPQRGHVARVWAYDAQWLMSYAHKRHNVWLGRPTNWYRPTLAVGSEWSNFAVEAPP